MNKDNNKQKRESDLHTKLELLQQQNMKDGINISPELKEYVEGVKDTKYKAELKHRRAIGQKIENWIVLILLLGSIAIALSSCSTPNGEFCVEDCTLVAYMPSYLTCDTEEQTFTYRIDTTYNWMYDNCECNENLRLLEKSFWEIVETYPEDEQFMFYEVPARYQCVKN